MTWTPEWTKGPKGGPYENDLKKGVIFCDVIVCSTWVYSWVYLGILNFLLLNSSIEKSYLLNLSNNTELLTPGVIWNREEYFIENAMFDTNQCLVHKSH